MEAVMGLPALFQHEDKTYTLAYVLSSPVVALVNLSLINGKKVKYKETTDSCFTASASHKPRETTRCKVNSDTH